MLFRSKLFEIHCGSCHGPDGSGRTQFPNLADAVWQWGGDPASISETIRSGRTALMPAWSEILDAKTLDAISRYVRSEERRVGKECTYGCGNENDRQTRMNRT